MSQRHGEAGEKQVQDVASVGATNSRRLLQVLHHPLFYFVSHVGSLLASWRASRALKMARRVDEQGLLVGGMWHLRVRLGQPRTCTCAETSTRASLALASTAYIRLGHGLGLSLPPDALVQRLTVFQRLHRCPPQTGLNPRPPNAVNPFAPSQRPHPFG